MKNNLKKTLLLGLSFILVTAVAIGGTLAYLTSEDSDVNVMTLGNVSIAQHEYQRVVNADGTYATATIDNQTSYVLEEFKQAKPLLPIVGDPSLPGDNPEYAGWDSTIVRMTQVDSYGFMQVFAGKNAQDKFVTVENTGKTDAYVRTLVAIECGTGDANLIGTSTRCVKAENAATNTAPWISNYIGKITIDANTYVLYEYIYRGANDVNRHVNGVLPAGDTTYPNLAQVYLKSETTNEDCKALDGNGNGTLDILVLSQAVQTAGFENAEVALDTAFGNITTTNHPWSVNAPTIPTVVSNSEELAAAIANGGEVILNNDITDVNANNTITVAAGKDVTLNLNGHKLSATANKNGNQELFLVKGNMTIKTGSLELTAENNQGWNSMATIFDVTAGGVLNMDGVTAKIGGTDMNFIVHLNNWGAATLNVNNCDFTASYVAIRAFNSGYDMNNITVKNTNFHNGRVFWVHNYTSEGKDDSTLNLNIYGNNNTSDNEKPVRFGFSDSVYYDINGNQL